MQSHAVKTIGPKAEKNRVGGITLKNLASDTQKEKKR